LKTVDSPDEKKKVFERFSKAIEDLEKRRKSRIFCILHTGPPAHICGPELYSLFVNRNKFENVGTLEILLHSPGGHADPAYKLMRFFRRKAKKLNVLVPLMAKSAATLMCLAADAIHMGELAELGPLDVQLSDPVETGEKSLSPLNEFKSMEFLADHAMEVLDLFSSVIQDRYGMSVRDSIEQMVPCVTAMMKPLYEAVNPLTMGEHRRDLAVGEQYAKRLLMQTSNPHVEDIVHRLVWDYPSHDFAIDFEEARTLQLPVEQLDPKQSDQLVDLILELGKHDISYTGFVSGATRKSGASPKKPRRKVPTHEANGQKKVAAA
jgi:hypothetical protein